MLTPTVTETHRHGTQHTCDSDSFLPRIERPRISPTRPQVEAGPLLAVRPTERNLARVGLRAAKH